MSVNFFTLLTSAVMIAAFILFPDFAVGSASAALNSFISSIVPSLFPFIICVNMLSNAALPAKKSGFLRHILNLPSDMLIPIFIGLLSGFPMGSKIVSNLYAKGKINSDEAQRLLSFINNPSPVFAVCVIGTGLLGSAIYGRLIFISCHCGAFLTALIFKFYYTPAPKKLPINSIANKTDIITDSISSILKIGAYIIFFAILGDIIDKIPIVGTPFSILTEMTSGSKKIVEIIGDTRLAVSFLAFLLSSGGICIQFQILGFLNNVPIKKSVLIFSALLKSAFSFLFCFVFFPFFKYTASAYALNITSHFIYDSGLSLLYITIPMALITAIFLHKKRQV